jgi:class 3 adenylate cyclase
MKIKLELLIKTIRHRSTILLIAGWVIAFFLYWIVKEFAPTNNFKQLPFWSLFLMIIIPGSFIISLNYYLLSGKWSLQKWGKMFGFALVPGIIIFTYFGAYSLKYFIISIMIYCTGMLILIGIFPIRAYLLLGLLFSIMLLIFSYIINGEEMLEQWVLYCVSIVVFMTFQLFIGMTSNFQIDRSKTIRSFLRKSRRDKRTIAEERKKSENLLLNILPEEVAKELKEKGANEPIHYDSVTVLFTDFQGFTQVSETMSPKELVGELDKCFSYFDAVTKKYKLEKIKTIGDSYMICGGIPAINTTHPIDSVLAAMEIQAFMNQMKEIKSQQSHSYWELRLGINTGPLVAGVIGEMKFAYDVFGDTVNTASRMESSGEPGKINISAATYELVKDLFDCEYRGKVPAKNKGMVDMYFLNQIKADLSVNGEGRVPNDKFKRMYIQRKRELNG